ncbi:pyridoxamine 5'-phosphate oxidase family protein [Mariniplasma anaerobium]|uniref:Heme utilization protein HutZ n=1 Tax=Mariniplasma anaerobium TaxID=2735436 RepID=A0A7U9TGY1_9MOLU|nr:pyridoxamine 5'-phosphate oxidase family protein [Mariniplasma anaerobium]BCR36317.1 heme utilization protein HutZ [Mariniplasma anaerobium]
MKNSIEKVQDQLNSFTSNFLSVVISTITNEQKPYTSYAPYVFYDNHYYFLISMIAKHYDNLSLNQNASIMFIQDEAQTPNIFFRKRLSYAVSTILDIKDDMVKGEFVKRFGDMATMLFKMDFLIVKCNIENGRFVIGPGQAYNIDCQRQIINQATNPKGHNKK